VLDSLSLSAMQGERLLGMPMLDALVVVCLPGVWLACFIFFALRSALTGAQQTDRIGRLAVSPYLPRVVMEFGYWMFTLPIALLLRLGVTANMITAASMVFTIIGAIFFGAGHVALGGGTLLLAFSCDAWDGIVARKRGTSSPAGEFLDATVDRYNDLIAFFGVMYYYRQDPLPLALAALAAMGSTVTSYARAKGESVGIDPNIGYMQRHERAVYLGGAAVVSPVVVAWLEPNAVHPHHYVVIMSLGLLAFLTNLTAYLRTRFVIVGLRARAAASEDARS
jgi:CDP-diacylglycerol--glycerol-3-phosphate 3-phosphatidyltransferase